MAYGDILEYTGVKYKNITPNMTSDTTPAPHKISVSSYYEHDYWYPYCAFSDPPKNNTIWWWTSNGSGSQWCVFDYGAITKVDMIIYELIETCYVAGGKVAISGSNDGAKYTEIAGKLVAETVVQSVAYCPNPKRRFYYLLNQSAHYRYYRFNMTIPDTGNWFTAGYIRFYETELKNSFLLKDNGIYKTIETDKLKVLADQNITSTNFKQLGFTDPGKILAIKDALSNSFDLLCLSSKSANEKVKVGYLPLKQLVVPTKDIDIIAYSTINQITLTTTGITGTVKLALSFNHGRSWHTIKNDAWQSIDLTADVVAASGITPAGLFAIASARWSEVVMGTLRVAYCLSKTSVTDDLAVDSLQITGDTSAWYLANDGDYACNYPNATTMQVKLLTDGSYKINYFNKPK